MSRHRARSVNPVPCFVEVATMTQSSTPLPVHPAPDPVDPALEPLLREPFASAYAHARAGAEGPPPQAASAALRDRLMNRLAASRVESQALFTARRTRLARVALAPGVHARTLYAAAGGRQRPGEPVRARLVELQAGSHWVGAAPGLHREWLVLQGSLHIGDVHLGLRDYHVAPAAAPADEPAQPAPGRVPDGAAPGDAAELRSEAGALVFLRESVAPAGSASAPCTVRDAAADWPDFAPGIRRRVLWQHAGQAAMLYLAQPGASVPLHTHGHDEECLMVAGELFLDDVLLQAGDYQLAPAGTGHRITETDTGVILYAHGDLDLKFVA